MISIAPGGGEDDRAGGGRTGETARRDPTDPRPARSVIELNEKRDRASADAPWAHTAGLSSDAPAPHAADDD